MNTMHCQKNSAKGLVLRVILRLGSTQQEACLAAAPTPSGRARVRGARRETSDNVAWHAAPTIPRQGVFCGARPAGGREGSCAGIPEHCPRARARWAVRTARSTGRAVTGHITARARASRGADAFSPPPPRPGPRGAKKGPCKDRGNHKRWLHVRGIVRGKPRTGNKRARKATRATGQAPAPSLTASIVDTWLWWCGISAFGLEGK